METKELKVNIPEGYEIDIENSTFEYIKFKPKAITYEDVAKELFLDKDMYYIGNSGVVFGHGFTNDCTDAVNCISSRQGNKILALNKLINVAAYLNKDWTPVFDGNVKNYTLSIDGDDIVVDVFKHICHVGPYFKSIEDARKAIKILGEDTIRLALSQV